MNTQIILWTSKRDPYGFYVSYGTSTMIGYSADYRSRVDKWVNDRLYALGQRPNWVVSEIFFTSQESAWDTVRVAPAHYNLDKEIAETSRTFVCQMICSHASSPGSANYGVNSEVKVFD